MQLSSIPIKIQTPFAEDNQGLTTDIPQSTTSPGRASWQLGFTSTNMEALAAGGVPPYGQDFNGVLFAISQWLQWMNAGGPLQYDSAFSSEVGGYPKYATVEAADGLGTWLSQVDNNTVNPDTTVSVQWTRIPLQQVYVGSPDQVLAGNAATLYSPPNTCWDSQEGVLYACILSGSTGTARWTPVADITPIVPTTGNTRNYVVATDCGKFFSRSNSGVGMSDILPTQPFTNGWNVGVHNADANANVVVGVPAGFSLNGKLNGTVPVGPGQSAWFVGDANGNFITFGLVPTTFAGEAIYVNSSGTYQPGVYHADTSAGNFTFTFPTTPALGDNFVIRDVYGTFGSANLTINPNGNTIGGLLGTLALDVSWMEYVFTFKSGDWELA